MRLRTICATVSAATAAVLATYAAPAQAATATRTAYPRLVQERLAEIKAHGGRDIKIVSVPYTKKSKSGSSASSTAAAVTPDSFPSGCGLYVYIFRDGD